MDMPRPVSSTLGEEEPFARVSLGGDDLLLATPTRTVVYRADGLLRDESVESYPHDADRISLSQGRRKTTIRFEYIDGPERFSVPNDRVEDVLGAILRGVLAVGGVVEDGESIEGVYRFSELTLVVTSDRLVKHVGAALWDADHETFPYAELTGLSFSEGNLATEITVEIDGRPDRVKAPNDSARFVQQDLQRAVFAYHDVDSLEALAAKVGREKERSSAANAFMTDDLDSLVPEADDDRDATEDDSDDEDGDEATEWNWGGDDPDTVVADVGAEAESEESTSDGSDAGSPASPAGSTVDGTDEVAAEVAALRETVERQGERLDRQAELLERLVEELRQGR